MVRDPGRPAGEPAAPAWPGRRWRRRPGRAGRRCAPGAVLVELAGRLPLVDTHSGLSRQEAAILWQLRLPRVVLGGLVGAMLALAGGAYQGVFRNPLADPYLLGAAAGAGLGATLAIAYGPDTAAWPVDLLPLAAFAGAVTGVAAAYALGALRRGQDDHAP